MKRYLPAILLMLILISGCAVPSGEGLIALHDWEINTGSGWMKTGPVPWEFPVEQGGLNLQYDGHAQYRTKVRIPASAAERRLAFYCGGIDDADVTFFDGNEIGSTGQMPEHAGGFRSASMHPRFYQIHIEKNAPEKEYELLIKVYDFAGNGGFAYGGVPVIGNYDSLKPVYLQRFYMIDAPRTALLGGSIIIAVILFAGMCRYMNRGVLSRFAGRIISGFNIIGFFRGSRTAGLFALKDAIKVDELFYRTAIAFWVNLCFAVLIMSQVSYKHALISSEVFWFRAPMAAIYFCFIGIVLLYHRESFGPFFSGEGISIKRIISAAGAVLTHPLLMLFFPVYLFFLPLNMAWSTFMVNGFLIIFSALSLLFVLTIINFSRASRASGGYLKGVFRREFFFRIIFLFSCIGGIAVFEKSIGILQTHGALIFVTGGIIYMMHSITFYRRFSIILPIKTGIAPSLNNVLRMKYKLSKWQADICELMNSGMTPDDICTGLSISPETLENHLKLIANRIAGSSAGEKSLPVFDRVISFVRGLEADIVNYPDDFLFHEGS